MFDALDSQVEKYSYLSQIFDDIRPGKSAVEHQAYGMRTNGSQKLPDRMDDEEILRSFLNGVDDDLEKQWQCPSRSALLAEHENMDAAEIREINDIVFRLGARDAEALAREFAPEFTPTDAPTQGRSCESASGPCDVRGLLGRVSLSPKNLPSRTVALRFGPGGSCWVTAVQALGSAQHVYVWPVKEASATGASSRTGRICFQKIWNNARSAASLVRHSCWSASIWCLSTRAPSWERSKACLSARRIGRLSTIPERSLPASQSERNRCHIRKA
jgi:hypothetical protein